MVAGRSGEDVEVRKGDDIEKEGVERMKVKERRGYSGRRKEWRGCRG